MKSYDYSFFSKDEVASDDFTCSMMNIFCENLETLESSVWMSEPLLTFASYITVFNHMLHHGKLKFKNDKKFMKFDTDLDTCTMMNTLVICEDIKSNC